MRKVPYSSEPLLLAADQRVWVDWVNGVSVDPVEQHKHIDQLEGIEAAAKRAVKEASYCRDEWPGAWAMVALASALDAAGKGPAGEEE